MNAGALLETCLEVLSVFVLGFVDSISIHKTAVVLYSDRPILIALCKCLAVNLILLLGSIYVHDSILLPSAELLQNRFVLVTESSTSSAAIDFSKQGLTIIYSSCWLIPMWGLCYLLSLQWYQDISALLQSRDGTAKRAVDVKSQIVRECYVFVAWLVLYLCTHLFLSGIPKVTDIFEHLCGLASSKSSGSALVATSSMLRHILRLGRLSSKFAGFSIQALCYGWYGFDYHWAFKADDYKLRFKRVEDHWPYFLGYGLPYVLIVHQTSFLVGFGIYLTVFPFTIILSATDDYTVSHGNLVIPPAKIFRLPAYYANVIIKFALKSSSRYVQFDSVAEKKNK